MNRSAPRLRIWLVQIGEELPFDPGPPRLLRTALLARELVKRGHEVTFWNASFNHQQKLLRSRETIITDTGEGYRAVLLKGRPYSRNISIARILSQRENAAAFRAHASNEPRPDVILSGLPSLEIADAASEYAATHRIPIAIDCRDLWPDVIKEFVPAYLKWLSDPIMHHWERMLQRATRRATAITGVSEGFVDWGVRAAGRARTPEDRPFHLTYSAPSIDPETLKVAEAYWDARLGPSNPSTVLGVYAGTLSRRFDLLTIAQAYEKLPTGAKRRLRLVICGKGDREGEFAALASREPGIIAAGWRSAAELHVLMSRATFGLLPYHRSGDFVTTFPNKVGEYLFFGLPIMTGLGGTTGALLAEHGLEIPYQPGDIDSAAAALLDLSRRGGRPQGWRAAARAAFHAHFEPKLVLGGLADFLEDLAKTGRAARTVA